jgi:hypothetical protein
MAVAAILSSSSPTCVALAREEAERPAFVDSHESKWEEKKA